MATMVDIKSDKPIPAYLVEPTNEAKGAVIVIHEVWGLTDHIKSIAERVAEAGYIALAPDLLSGSGIEPSQLAGMQNALFDPKRRNEVQPKLRELMAPIQSPEFADLTTARLKDCFEYLFVLPQSQQRVAVIGFCFGGTYSFNLAVSEPRLRLALPFYGHSDHSLAELKQISCPIYAFYGEKDERLIMQLPQLVSLMEQAGVDFNSQVYPDCGHAFFNDTNPFAYSEAAAQAAWQTALGALTEHLG